MTIRAVIFDIGGVLFCVGNPAPHRKWEARLGLPEGDLARVVYANAVARQALIGQATPEEVWAEVASRLSLTPDELQTLRTDFSSGYALNEELMAFIRALRPGVKTGIISDAFSDAREIMSPYINDDAFDVIVFSAEEGVQKPNPEIFERALSRLGAAAEETIFVDDSPHNVRGARSLGIHAIQFTTSFQVREEINRLLHT
jgi:epoxide hydrolase-like predicted phosphatase